MTMTKKEQRPEFLGLPAVSKRLGVSVALARLLAKDPAADFPPSFKLGRRRLVSARQLDRWIASKHGDAA